MIIDRIRTCGPNAYLRREDDAADVNLGGAAPTLGRTAPPERGEQLDVDALHLFLEGDDLLPLFDPQPALDAGVPLLSLTVMKELFPGLFADPFRSRVHTVAGFDDFGRGAFQRCRALEVEGIPTLVSLGTGACRWTSPVYPLSRSTTFTAAAWELASVRNTPPDAFHYRILLRTWDVGQPLSDTPQAQPLADGLDARAPRAVSGLDVAKVGAFQLVFEAQVRTDPAFHEHHVALAGESIGRPLLRAVNLLEPVPTVYDFHSIVELLARASDHRVFQTGGEEIHRLSVSLDLSAKLVHSQNQRPEEGLYEFLEVKVGTGALKRLVAHLEAEEARRVEEA